MTRWGDEKTLLFIKYYKEHECLWNSLSPLYKNKIARINAYTSLLQRFDEKLSVKAIRTKIKNLRTTYHQELNKIKDSMRSGDGSSEVYKPTISWFKEMDSFLGETLQNRPTISSETVTLTSAESSESMLSISQSDILASEQTSERQRRFEVNDLELNQVEQQANNDQEPIVRKETRLFTNKTSRATKRQHDETKSEPSNALKWLENISTIINTTKAVEDEFHHFGMNIAAQLRTLPLHVALQLQAEFQNKLFLARVRNQFADTLPPVNTSSPSSACNMSPQGNEQFEQLNFVKEEVSPPD